MKPTTYYVNVQRQWIDGEMHDVASWYTDRYGRMVPFERVMAELAAGTAVIDPDFTFEHSDPAED